MQLSAAAAQLLQQAVPGLGVGGHLGADPVQVPVETVSVWPWLSVPVIKGAAVFCGAVATGAAVTVLVGAEVAWPLPTPLLAVTWMRRLFATSTVCAV